MRLPRYLATTPYTVGLSCLLLAACNPADGDPDGGAQPNPADSGSGTVSDSAPAADTASPKPDVAVDSTAGAVDAGVVWDTDAQTTPVPDTGAQPSPDAEVIPPPAWPDEGVTVIELDESGHAALGASFDGVGALETLEWAREPTVACWDSALTDEFFSGPHLAFALSKPIPPWHEVTVTITPDAGIEANLYVLQTLPNQVDLPPNVTRAEFCYQPVRYGTGGDPQQVVLRTYGDETRNILFGVSNRARSARDRSGAFQVQVQASALPPGPERCYAAVEDPDQWPDHVRRLKAGVGEGIVEVGDLSQGSPVCGDLEYLDDAFCVPATQLDAFAGPHVFYALDEGIPDQSFVTVTVTPDPGVDVNLYGSFQGAGTGFYVPPLYPLQNCDASLTPRAPNPGEPESLSFFAFHNPYNIGFAVAGSDSGQASGGYVLTVEVVSTRTDNCTADDYDAVRNLDRWPGSVTRLQVENGVAVAHADLADGHPQCTLDWASNSSVACFPATINDYYRGNHLFFALSAPPAPGSNVYVRVIPDDDVEVSLYGYRLGTDRYMIPPLVPSVGQCEASNARTIFEHTPNPGVIESIEFYNPGANAYNYFFGVAGFADGQHEGRFTLEVEVQDPPPPHCPESLPGATYPTWPSFVTSIALDDTGHGVADGDLATGACTNLDFASSSQVACFPATQFDRFKGNHVYYALAEPMPPRSELTITVTPAPDAEVNIYGFQSGVTHFPVPPAVRSGVCEASFAPSARNPGEAETLRFFNPSDRNLYNIFLAVAGDSEDGMTGAFDIAVQQEVGVVHCEASLPGPANLEVWPANVERITLDDDLAWSGAGDLSGGACVNLDFASTSQVACFPATQNEHYEGDHVFYAIDDVLPPHSTLSITVLPDPEVDVSLYGLQLGDTNYPSLPPNIPTGICEASNSPRDPNPGEPETITFTNPTEGNEYHIFFAVAGHRDSRPTDAFTVDVAMTQSQTHCPESLPGQPHAGWPDEVRLVALDDQGQGEVEGDLGSGRCMNLDFAAQSDVACFPATQNEHYRGNHVFYALDQPLPPRSELVITAEPAAGVDVSLYGLQTGAVTHHVPPYVPSVIACEASNPWRRYNPGESESIRFSNPSHTHSYNVFFAVAGTDQAGSAGAYTVRLQRN